MTFITQSLVKDKPSKDLSINFILSDDDLEFFSDEIIEHTRRHFEKKSAPYIDILNNIFEPSKESNPDILLEKATLFLKDANESFFKDIFEAIQSHLCRPCLITKCHDDSGIPLSVEVSIDKHLLFKFDKSDMLLERKEAIVNSKLHEIQIEFHKVAEYIYQKAKSNKDRVFALQAFNNKWQDYATMHLILSEMSDKKCILESKLTVVDSLKSKYTILGEEGLVASCRRPGIPFFSDIVTEADLNPSPSLLSYLYPILKKGALISTLGFFAYQLTQSSEQPAGNLFNNTI